MRILNWLFGRASQAATAPFEPEPTSPARFGVPDLCRRLGIAEDVLRATPIQYRQFKIPKRRGGQRQLSAPDLKLKHLQRLILRRLLRRLKAHPAATGFERGHSIVTHAAHHAGQAVIVRIDIKDFFDSTPAARVRNYFRSIGWDAEAAQLLTSICTYDGRLPQGAPTSPRLSNLVNRRLDTRLENLAVKFGARYSRYADDLTFSFAIENQQQIHGLVRSVQNIVYDCGYTIHMKKKLSIRRRHQRQIVTGLVVNDSVNLPRSTRRRLRAIEHRARMEGGPEPTLSETQRQGWRALQRMIEEQRPDTNQGPA